MNRDGKISTLKEVMLSIRDVFPDLDTCTVLTNQGLEPHGLVEIGTAAARLFYTSETRVFNTGWLNPITGRIRTWRTKKGALEGLCKCIVEYKKLQTG